MKKNMNSLFRLLLLSITAITLTACSDDDEGAPRIDSVWYNMVSRPIEQAPCAYPGQTLCLHGSGFGGLKQVIVNDTEINLNTLFVYESSNNITFQLPANVNTTGDYIKVVTAGGQATIPFVVRPASEKPEITAFSATTLIAGRTLTITGVNLEGATEVWLPLAFDGRVKCEFDPTQISSDNTIHVIIPADVTFATGQCEVVMEKQDALRDITYTEKVFSASTNFK